MLAPRPPGTGGKAVVPKSQRLARKTPVEPTWQVPMLAREVVPLKFPPTKFVAVVVDWFSSSERIQAGPPFARNWNVLEMSQIQLSAPRTY